MPGIKNKEKGHMDNVNRLRVGHIAPRIVLDNSEGEKIDSWSFVGKSKVVIVFFKGKNNGPGSGWLEELNKSSGKIDLSSGIILAISVDQPRVTRKLKQKLQLRFSLLYDKRSEAISAYGVLDSSSEKGEPHPATFIVDRIGIIRYRKVYSDYEYEPAAGEIISLLEEVT